MSSSLVEGGGGLEGLGLLALGLFDLPNGEVGPRSPSSSSRAARISAKSENSRRRNRLYPVHIRSAQISTGTRPVWAPRPGRATELMLPGWRAFCIWTAWKAAAQARATL